ncbi:MAG: hypothetical protein ABL891_10345 [Burkholderiales bacterium]
MNWDRIEDNCKQFNGSVIERWDDLTENQIGSCIRDTYAIADDEADCELSDWELRLSDVGRDD